MKKKRNQKLTRFAIILLGIIIAFILIVGAPIAINELYKTNTGYMTLWGAKEVLSYYGVIIASIVGVVGVYISIQAANKNYRDDVKARVLPFIALTPFEKHARIDPFDLFSGDTKDYFQSVQDDNSGHGYFETKIDKIFFVVNSGKKIDAKQKLRKEQYEIINHAGAQWTPMAKGVKGLTYTDYLSMPFEIESVGNGTAVNLRVGFNALDSDFRYIRPMMLKQNQSLYIHIFSTEKFDVISGDYVFEVYYEDIYGNKYSQKFPVKFGTNEEGKEYQSIELTGKQVPVKEVTAHAHP